MLKKGFFTKKQLFNVFTIKNKDIIGPNRFTIINRESELP
jgi:hypothetical protein